MRALGLRCVALAVLLLAAACGGDDEAETASAPDNAGESSAAEAAAGTPAAAPIEGVGSVDTTLFHDAQRAPLADAIAAYERDCAGAASAECKRLRWRLEAALYEDVRELARVDALDDELIRAGAAAEMPQLKAFCLERIRARGLKPGEEALVIAAFDDPYPAVRTVAQDLARQLPDEQWARRIVRDTGRRSGGVRGFVADEAPDAKRLGAPHYPGARYWHFASSAEYGAFFTTPDAPDDVVAFYAKGGKPVLTGEEVEARLEAVKNAGEDPTLIMQKMQDAMAAGEDPSAVMASLTEGATSSSVDWTDGIDGREGIAGARYVVLAEEQVFGQPVPARVVSVFRDEAMGATGLIFRNKPELPRGPDLSTPEAVEAFTRVQQILSSPDAQPPY